MVLIDIRWTSGTLLWEKSQWKFDLQDAANVETECRFFLIGVDLDSLSTILGGFIFDFFESWVEHEISQMCVNHA